MVNWLCFQGDAVKKYGKENIKTYTATFMPMYHAVTQRKIKHRMKLVCLLPQEKVIMVCFRAMYSLIGYNESGMYYKETTSSARCQNKTNINCTLHKQWIASIHAASGLLYTPPTG